MKAIACLLLASCAINTIKPQPSSMPASQPSSMPASAPVNVGALWTPIDPKQPNGDQRITRANQELLVSTIVRERGEAKKEAAGLKAQIKVISDDRDAKAAEASGSLLKTILASTVSAAAAAAITAGVEALVDALKKR